MQNYEKIGSKLTIHLAKDNRKVVPFPNSEFFTVNRPL